MEEKDFEPAGLIPRSIIRTVERFQQQLRPETVALGIQEFRISRYQVRVSVRYFFILLLLPITINWGAKNLIIKPLVGYFWNTYQTSLFLNSYQAERAFQEMRDFESQLFFEMLLSHPENLSETTNQISKKITPGEIFLDPEPLNCLFPNSNIKVSKNNLHYVSENVKQQPSKDQFLEGPYSFLNNLKRNKTVDVSHYFKENKIYTDSISRLNSLTVDKQINVLSTHYNFCGPKKKASALVLRSTTNLNELTEFCKAIPKDITPVIPNKFLTNLPNANLNTLQTLENLSFKKLKFEPLFIANYMENFNCQNKAFDKRHSYKLFPEGKIYISSKSIPEIKSGTQVTREYLQRKPDNEEILWGGLHKTSNFSKDISDQKFVSSKISLQQPYTGPLLGETELQLQKTDSSGICFESLFQKKTVLLAEIYNQQSITALSNMFGDCVMIFATILLVRWNGPQFTILKSFLIESFYSFNDAIKCFYIILITDFLVGFHSPRGWEIAMEMLLRHLGLPENEEFILLFVGTFPVFLDTAFKYWIFRYLNKISPSTVATYHSMIE